MASYQFRNPTTPTIKYKKSTPKPKPFITCPHQYSCTEKGTVYNYCYDDYEDEVPCPNYERKEEPPCTKS